MKSNEIRSSFLDFFAKRGHKIVPSAPLIPHDDPTLLFVNAGMNQFKNVFTGLEKRDYKTAASSQKCIRAGGKHNDLENVGFTARHHTFFEMLGNFSFGGYFKEEAILYAWEYVTGVLGLEPERLYATVFTDDDDAEKLWRKIAPELGDRVLRFGEKDNFWAMGDIGPCGPCSELHYDRGESYPGELNGEGDRFMEIWNLVFMQYNRDDTGKLTPLPKPSVDTGAGLERFSMIMQNGESNYDTDLFTGLIRRVSELSGVDYSTDEKGTSHRVIADHARALTFAIADGGVISNEGRGYVLRRILRRAARHGKLLGMHEPFLYKTVEPLVKLMGGHYPEIKTKRDHIELVIKSEEEQFGRTLDTGLEIFEDIVKKVESSGSKVIPGADVFKLYDTFGFPVDLTEVMAAERGLHADMDGFEQELEKQKERSRSAGRFYIVRGDEDLDFPRDAGVDRFVGYENECLRTEVLNVRLDNELYRVILNQTPFYAESGGQVGDIGIIKGEKFEITVENTIKQGEEHVHFGEISRGSFDGDLNITVTAEIDHERRADIKRNHTATHLLHKALKMVLGDHVNQAGSLVAPDRLRFDFTHPKAMTDEQIGQVEGIVKEKIKEDLEVTWKNMPFDDAKAMGAMALFGEKYGDTVRVVKTGEFTMELCGGTHVDRTSDIRDFFITQETAIAAGMRRIEALTGRELENYMTEQNKIMAEIKNASAKKIGDLNTEEISDIKNKIYLVHRRLLKREKLDKLTGDFLNRLEDFQKEQKKLDKKRLTENASEIEPAASIKNGKILVYLVPAANMNEIMIFVDRYKSSHNDSTVITVSSENGSFAIISPDGKSAQEVFEVMVSEGNARGGGKGTIRGSVPTDKIEAVIGSLKRKFE